MAERADTPPDEIWKPVLGYETSYQVSSLGRIRALPRWVGSKNGSFALKSGRLMTAFRAPSGYPTVRLSHEGSAKTVSVHRLVCEAFHGPPPFAGAQVAHRDGSRDNNRPQNLRWDTAKGNAADRTPHGTERRGEAASNAKLTAQQVLDIRRRYAPGYGSLAKLGREYGITSAAVLAIIQRKNWKHI